MTWTLVGHHLFRPEGGPVYLEQICSELLARQLEHVESLEGQDAEWPDHSAMALILRDGRVAGLWVRFGSDYPVPNKVDAHTPPAIPGAFVAACRARNWAVRGAATTARGGLDWTWNLTVVLEWPADVLARAQSPVQEELLGGPTPLPPDGSALAVVRGQLRRSGLVEVGRILPVPPGMLTTIIEDRWPGGAAGLTEPAPAETEWTAEEEAEEPESDEDSGFGVPEESMESGFGIDPHHDDEPSIEPAPPSEPPPAPELERVPWDAWLQDLATVSIPEKTPADPKPVAGFCALDDGRVGRFLSGWISPDLAIERWGPPRGLGDRSRVGQTVVSALSGLFAALLLVGLGLLAARTVGAMIGTEATNMERPPAVRAVPTVSFCSDSNPAFVDALGCWTERLTSPDGAPSDFPCSTAPATTADLRSQWCGLQHRGPTGTSLGDEALARACYQVLGEPDQYTLGPDRPDTRAFFFSPQLEVSELVDLRQDLTDDCDRCEEDARSRVRRLAAVTWVAPQLRAPELGLPGSGWDPDLCPAPMKKSVRKVWSTRPNDQTFAYEPYSAARFGRLAADGSVTAPGARPDEWACWASNQGSTSRVQLATALDGVRVLAPATFDPDGLQGLVSQLGLHALLTGEVTGAPGPAACARLVQQELAAAPSAHPVLGVEATDFAGLCGQVCGGYFEVASASESWHSRRADLDLCVSGVAGKRAPERVCSDTILPTPRTRDEREHRRLEGRRDAADLALPCDGPVEVSGPVLASTTSRKWGVGGVLFDPEKSTLGGDPYSIPDPIAACALQLIVQEDLVPAGVPPLLPEGTTAETFGDSVETLAGRLARRSATEQRSRSVCEEVGALCFTSAALMVKADQLLWENASELARRDTGESLAITMGPSLERWYRDRCDDRRATGDLAQERASCAGGWRKAGYSRACAVLCESGAPSYLLAARYADPSARLDSAFELSTWSHLCGGLEDLWSGDGEAEVTWESSCVEGLRSRRTQALQLLQEGQP